MVSLCRARESYSRHRARASGLLSWGWLDILASVQTFPVVQAWKFIHDIALGTSASFHGIDWVYLTSGQMFLLVQAFTAFVTSDILAGQSMSIVICFTILSLRPLAQRFSYSWRLIGVCALCAIGYVSHVVPCAINSSHHLVICTSYISR